MWYNRCKLYSVRLSVRTLGFQPKKRGSIPLPSTKYSHSSKVEHWADNLETKERYLLRVPLVSVVVEKSSVHLDNALSL